MRSLRSALRRPAVALICGLAAAGTVHPAPVPFTVQSGEEVGIDFLNVCGDPPKAYIIEANGAGCALVDLDRDGRLDVVLINGTTMERMRKSGGDPVVAVYRNSGSGKFENVSAMVEGSRRGWGMGVSVTDVNADSFPDLYVTGFGRNYLYINREGKALVESAEAWGLESHGWSTGAGWADFDRDGDLDVYIVRYVEFDVSKPPVGLGCDYFAEKVFCGPRGLEGAADSLYLQQDGRFVEATVERGAVDGGKYFGFGALAFDYDRDGWADIYVANDSNRNYLFRNTGGRFRETGVLSGAAVNEDGKEQSGMGTETADWNGDGWPDLVVTNFSNDYHTLYLSRKGEFFSDASYHAGLAMPTIPSLGWGALALDHDQDGRLDLFVANGHVYPAADERRPITSYLQPFQLFAGTGGGRFRGVPIDVPPTLGRGVAAGDIDNDGDVDLLVNVQDGRPLIFWNRQNQVDPSRGWLLLELSSSRGLALGAKVTVRTGERSQYRELIVNRGYLSASDPRLHFGLAAAKNVQIDVEWPSGRKQSWRDVAPNQWVELIEGTAAPRVKSEAPD
jgi:hypothetical protein